MLLELLLVWVALFAALMVFAIGRPAEGGALTLAYFLGVSMIHVPGVLPFLGSGSGLDDQDATEIGFGMTILGMAAYIAGAVLARRRVAATSSPTRRRAAAFEHLGWRALLLGVVAYFVLLPLSFRVPSLTSVVSPLGTVLILGFWLVLYYAAMAANRLRTLAMLALLPLLPIVTSVTGGIFGYGIYWDLSVVAFLFVITRRRIWFYLSAPAVIYFGLSFFVTYIDQRAGIRELVWQERTGLLNRLERASAIVTDFEFFDWDSHAHATALDDRLNQSALDGAAVIYHEDGLAPFAFGSTVSPWDLIPRVIWPDKPEIGGGSDIVIRFAGTPVSDGSSFGAGQVLEFYVNFGIPGVLIGFCGLGYLLMRLDRSIMRSLATGDTRRFLLRAMPGLTLLQPQGNLREILVACVAACLVAQGIASLRFFDVPMAARSRGQPA